tara:strand:+ start:3505 stop:3795 length:291 start_codon:yes stop_codon:yes gene_type:complete
VARVTGLEPAASGVTGRRSNQLSYTRLVWRGLYKGWFGLARAFFQKNEALIGQGKGGFANALKTGRRNALAVVWSRRFRAARDGKIDLPVFSTCCV